MKKELIFLFCFSLYISTYSQVKIGENPSQIHSNSILELESTDKVLVISRLSNTQMHTITPLKGAIIYNTDEKCVFMYNGSVWKSLCGGTSENIKVSTQNTAPINNNIGDFWINDTTTSIWDGNNWTSIDNNPYKGNGAPTNTTAPNPKAGDIYVNENTGSIYAYDGTSWINSSANIKANNGVLLNSDNTIQLGGAIIKPTIIETDDKNILAIKGLQEGDINEDDILTINKKTGQLRKITSSNLFREEVKVVFAANDGEKQFNPPLPISDSKKVNVYRNGVLIGFTVVNNTTIEVEPEATCYKNDEIRIVQFY